ncbi:MAG: hypothetical protein P8020_01600 [Acidobacteriota bacterium]|jgi:hypothetical protein
MGSSNQSLQTVDALLGEIIDDWFEKVSTYYITASRLADSDNPDQEEELKRFHDGNGHRIKFSKDELDFTYGLRSFQTNGELTIEVSVNNKVRNFDIGEFRKRLAAHYRKIGKELVPTPFELRNRSYSEIFLLESDFSHSLKLEIREGKADIMRLAFRLEADAAKKLIEHPVSTKQLVENYCVTPFRSIYASVYRRGS